MRWMLALLVMIAVDAAAVEGRIVVRWGDSSSGDRIERLQIDLALADGRVLALDPDSVAAQVGDVSALDGRSVRLGLGPATHGGTLQVLSLQTLHDASDLARAQAGVAGPWITLLCKFADVVAEPRSRGHMEAMLGEHGWMADYWAEQSGGRTDFAGSVVVGWLVLPRQRSYYVQPNQYARLDRLFEDCVAMASPQVDFSNGGAGIAGINLVFNAPLDCCAWGGGIFATVQGVHQRWPATWNPPFSYINPAALAHEMGHAYGLPHANNSDFDADTYDNPWDLMSDAFGHAVVDPVFGRMPKRLGGYSRARLGWIDNARIGRIDGDGVCRIRIDPPGNPEGLGYELVELRHPDWPPSRWLTLEMRDTDDPFDKALPGKGLVMHSVDEGRAQPAWVLDSDSPAANYSNTLGSWLWVGRRYTSPDHEFKVRIVGEEGCGLEVEVSVSRPIFTCNFGY